jgi:hypothetical protein
MLLLFFTSSLAYAHGISAEDQQHMLNAGYFQYFVLGAKHMLTGYDHLLFLFGVVFFLTRFRDILKFITAFTIGHSITLIFATIFKIHLNYFIIDAFIALTVCYKGFENVDGFQKFFQTKSPNLVAMVFFFGLVHGFGLSTRLQKLPLGTDGLVLRILSFNVGVEVGQILALIVIMLLLTGWRKTESFKRFSLASNSGLIIAGAFLFLMQMHGYSHTRSPDEFGFSNELHYHEHERLTARAHRLKFPDQAVNMNDSQAIERATTNVALIVTENERVDGEYLEESWLNLPMESKKIYKSNDKFYVVSFENPPLGKTLYVLLGKKGGFWGVNFDGKFESI